MILDQTIGSARAEKHKAMTFLVVGSLWTALMTSALAIWSQPAWGMDSPLPVAARTAARTADQLMRPPA